MIRSFASRSLRDFWAQGKSDDISADLQAALLRRLDVLDAAVRRSELRAAGLGLIASGAKRSPDRLLHVFGPWVLCFAWVGGFAEHVDLSSTSALHRRGGERKPRPLDRSPTHPGAILREDILPATRLTIINAAAQLGVSRQTLHRVLAETASVTPEMAVRLGRFCGNGAAIWLRIQSAHDLWWAERAYIENASRVQDAA